MYKQNWYTGSKLGQVTVFSKLTKVLTAFAIIFYDFSYPKVTSKSPFYTNLNTSFVMWEGIGKKGLLIKAPTLQAVALFFKKNALIRWREYTHKMYLVPVDSFCSSVAFVRIHNFVFSFALHVVLGTKSKLAAQWEIIPNKSPVNPWWNHASSEKEEDELD